MFNKEGIPFFIIIFPLLSLIFFAFFTASYYLKLSDEMQVATQIIYTNKTLNSQEIYTNIEQIYVDKKEQFINYLWVLSITILSCMLLFIMLMKTIIHDIIKEYKQKVKVREISLEELNNTLTFQVEKGIEEGKEKDKTILRESRLSKLGSTLSMIAHQWRQPLSELSGILMELEMAMKFNKLTDEKLLISFEKSNDRIEYMSSTIDDFRNFYKPDKVKEFFYLDEACKKALNLINASLQNASIRVIVETTQKVKFFGYPSEFAQAILNILSNAKDILIERQIENPTINLNLEISETQSKIMIEDNAGGIDENSIENIFDPYFSTKNSAKGTGLGLYIAQIIIEKNLGGKLMVKNDKQGAMFTIVLENNKND